MKKLVIILSLMLLLMACRSVLDNDEKEHKNVSLETPTMDNICTDKDIKIIENEAVENITSEYITSEGYRVIEYEDGYTTTFSPEGVLAIVNTPQSVDFTKYDDYNSEELPQEEGTEFFHDLRSRDLTRLDLSNEFDYLLTADLMMILSGQAVCLKNTILKKSKIMEWTQV